MGTVTKSGAVEKADAYLRRYSVIPDSEGDTTRLSDLLRNI